MDLSRTICSRDAAGRRRLARLMTSGTRRCSAPDADPGLRIDPDGAQKISAWYRGRDILATVLAMLPFPCISACCRTTAAPNRRPIIRSTTCCTTSRTTGRIRFSGGARQMFDLIDYGWATTGSCRGARVRASAGADRSDAGHAEKQTDDVPNGAVVAGGCCSTSATRRPGSRGRSRRTNFLPARRRRERASSSTRGRASARRSRPRATRRRSFGKGHDERRRARGARRPVKDEAAASGGRSRSSPSPASGTCRRC
jgi:hypothetical protein